MNNDKNSIPVIRREPFLRRHKNFAVGLFLLIPAVALPGFLLYTMMKADLFEEWRVFRVRYENCFGLERGNPVTISGMRVGNVDEVHLLEDGRIEVVLRVLLRYADLVRQDSRAVLRQKNMVVSEWVIELTLGSSFAPVAPERAYLESALPTRIDDVMGQVTSIASSFEFILKEIAQGRGVLGSLINDDSLDADFAQILSDAALLVKNSNLTILQAQKTLQSYETVGNQGEMLADTLMQMLVGLRPMVQRADTILGSVNGLSSELPAVVTQLQRDLVEIEVVLKSLQQHSLMRRAVQRHKATLPSTPETKSNQGAP